MDPKNNTGNPPPPREDGGVKKRTKNHKKIPVASASELRRNLIKSEAVLLRLTPSDKETINKAASNLGITTTELLTKSALIVAEKLGK